MQYLTSAKVPAAKNDPNSPKTENLLQTFFNRPGKAGQTRRPP